MHYRMYGCWRKWHTLTVKSYQNAECMQRDGVHMATLQSPMIFPSGPRQKCCSLVPRQMSFIRFSTVAGERGAADCERDIRGVGVKFYTEEGNWDLVGNNTPTFFVRDVHNFPGSEPCGKA
jgi:hypothetical protein